MQLKYKIIVSVISGALLIALLWSTTRSADLYQNFYIVCEHQGSTIEYDDSVPPVAIDTTENIIFRGIAIGKNDAQKLARLNRIWAAMKADDVDSANVYIFFGQVEMDSNTDCAGVMPTQLSLANYSSAMRAAYHNWGGK